MLFRELLFVFFSAIDDVRSVVIYDKIVIQMKQERDECFDILRFYVFALSLKAELMTLVLKKHIFYRFFFASRCFANSCFVSVLFSDSK